MCAYEEVLTAYWATAAPDSAAHRALALRQLEEWSSVSDWWIDVRRIALEQFDVFARPE